MKTLRALLLVSIVYPLAGCESHSAAEPLLPQEAVVSRVDPDAALADKVERALGVDTAAAYGVEVTAADGNIDLWGTVDSNAVRRRLELTAAGVVGVKSINSHLRVDPGA